MTRTIAGLDPAPLAPQYASPFATQAPRLAAQVARRTTAACNSGFPCRIPLENAPTGEPLLVQHVSQDIAGPFRIAHAIQVREGAPRAEPRHGTVPALIARRTIVQRAFEPGRAMRRAVLARPGEAGDAIRHLFADRAASYSNAHNAAHGCFLAGVERAS